MLLFVKSIWLRYAFTGPAIANVAAATVVPLALIAPAALASAMKPVQMEVNVGKLSFRYFCSNTSSPGIFSLTPSSPQPSLGCGARHSCKRERVPPMSPERISASCDAAASAAVARADSSSTLRGASCSASRCSRSAIVTVDVERLSCPWKLCCSGQNSLLIFCC